MYKVLNVITNGLKREGITSTQIDFLKHIDKYDLIIDIAAVHDDLPEVIKEFEYMGYKVIKFPDRNRNVIRYCVALYKCLKMNKYDAIHLHGSSSLMCIDLLVAKLAGVKRRIVHSRNTYCVNAKLDRILRPFFYRLYTDALACGEDAGKFLFPGRPFKVLYNGKDFEKFRFNNAIRKEYREKLGLKNKTAIGFVGRLNNQKNPLFLIDMIEKIHEQNADFQLILIGDGPRMTEVQEYVKNKKLLDSVNFAGRVDNVQEWLQALDIMVLPSLYEGLPNVVLEWQISGLPCLISDKVTKECAISSFIKFLPIENGVNPWVKEIMEMEVKTNREENSIEACNIAIERGFEINEGAKLLREFYLGANKE